ncbi:hypothetical protein TNCT_40651 [Trichonephila clavata]|uniref:Uncharacterized protein n=1 Tax=Trichonephila clavata TaxID=2740835 RepID=A0A8X6KSM6_TRICU|nr:hypothetical protein TNCT_40651 [Trichonephila clavata]
MRSSVRSKQNNFFHILAVPEITLIFQKLLDYPFPGIDGSKHKSPEKWLTILCGNYWVILGYPRLSFLLGDIHPSSLVMSISPLRFRSLSPSCHSD